MTSACDVAVVGGGIAGLTAALTSARLGRKTLVFTGDLLGGQLLSIGRVEGYPGFPDGVAGYDLCPMAEEQAAACGAELLALEVQSLRRTAAGWLVSTGTPERYLAGAVILATGARLRGLAIEGEARLLGKGVSHCASCDGPMMRGRPVAVVGGGDSAAQEALTLAQSASRVVLLHRGEALSAQANFRDRVRGEPKIELRLGCVVTEILGDTGVTGVRLRDSTGATTDLEVFGVFPYIGLEPIVGLLQDQLALGPRGGIPTDASMQTGLPGIFAAGAVREQWPGRAIASAGEGSAAAIAANDYLRRLG